MNKNKQELESKDLESSTNTKEIKQDSKNNTETKNKNSKNNTESYIKLDFNSDEIVWEYKCKKISFGYIFTIIHLVIISILCFIFILKGIDKFISRDDTDFFTTILLIIMALILLYPLYILFKLLNFKKMYITKEYFILIKYFGKKSIVPLGSFYIYIRYSGYGFIVNGYTTEGSLHSINPNLNISSASFLMTNAKDNIDKLYSHLLPYIEATLLGLNENDYNQSSFFMQTNIQPQIDWEKLDRLRKEKYDK